MSVDTNFNDIKDARTIGILKIGRAMADVPDSSDPVAVQLAVINTKLDILLAARDDQEARLRIQEGHEHEEIDDFEARLRKLEEFKWKLMGAALVIGASGGGAAAAIAKAISG